MRKMSYFLWHKNMARLWQRLQNFMKEPPGEESSFLSLPPVSSISQTFSQQLWFGEIKTAGNSAFALGSTSFLCRPPPHISHLIYLLLYVSTSHILNKYFQIKKLLAISIKIHPSQAIFIILNSHKINKSIKRKMPLPWTKHFWKLFISWEMHDRWHE